MGRFYLLVVLLAACGDNLEADEVEDPGLEFDSPDKTTPQPRYLPQVCGQRSWTPGIAGDIAVSIASREGGAAVLAVPAGGGSLTGYVLDARMDILTSTTVAIDRVFTSVTASVVNGRIISTGIEAGEMYLHLLDDNLGNPQFVVKLPGTHLAEPAFFNTQADLVMPLAGDDGLWLHRFDDAFEPIGATKVMNTISPVRSLAAAQMGTAMLTAMSTDNDCHLMLTSTFSTGPNAHTGRACPDPRLAVDPTTGAGIMVFNGDDGVRIMPMQNTQFGGDSRVLRAATHSPRAVFDGTRFWVSYLDSRGDVLVGLIDDKHQAITMSLAALNAPKPTAGAYELVLIDDVPWVITLGAEGYTAHRMCAAVEGAGEIQLGDSRFREFDVIE